MTEQFLPDDAGLADRPDLLTRAELANDVRPALVAAAWTAVAALLVGVLWALVAPGQEAVTTAAGSTAPLASESDHVFDATALFFLLATAYGVIAGAAWWRRRSRRGPVVLAALAVSTTAGAWGAAQLGVWLAGPLTDTDPRGVLVDRALASGGAVGGPPVPATLATIPPTIGSFWTVVGAGIGAVLAYLLCAIALGEEDLGR